MVYTNSRLSTGDLVIHPNDGFDLGLMHNRYPVDVHLKVHSLMPETDTLPVPGEIHLSNACRSGTLEVSQRQWEMMHKQEQVILAIKDKDIFIVSNKTISKVM